MFLAHCLFNIHFLIFRRQVKKQDSSDLSFFLTESNNSWTLDRIKATEVQSRWLSFGWKNAKNAWSYLHKFKCFLYYHISIKSRLLLVAISISHLHLWVFASSKSGNNKTCSRYSEVNFKPIFAWTHSEKIHY